MIAKALKTGLLAVAVFGLALVGCDKLAAPELTQPPDPAPVTTSAYPVVEDIIAGQNTDVGDLTIHFTYDNVFVTYQTTGNWYLTSTEVHIAESLAGIPSNSGGMQPGQFDYKATHSPSVQTYMFTIPMRDEWRTGACLYLAAHCNVQRVVNGQPVETQTGWSGDSLHPGRNWGLYIRFCIPKLAKLPTFPIKCRLGQVYKNIPVTMELDNIPENQGYYVHDGFWPSFCLQTGTYIYGNIWYDCILIPSTLPAPLLPNVIRYGINNSPTPYDKINYLINKYSATHHTDYVLLERLQRIFWYWRGYNITLTGEEEAIVLDANTNGVGYHPGPGQFFAVFLWIGESVQLTFIQVDP